MPREFNVEAPRSTFLLPALTKRQIAALMDDLDTDARSVIIMAVAQLWAREIGEPDVFAELDAVKRRLDAIERGNAMGWYVVSQHGSDGTPGPENTHTQTAFGPFATEGEAEAFKAKL